jgi:branched-chain amino acid transport system permease protein
MSSQDHTPQQITKGFKARLLGFVTTVPLIGWLLGIFGAVLVEYFLGDPLSYYLGLPKIPVLFGFLTVLKKPLLIPGTMGYLILVYCLPIFIIVKTLHKPANRLAGFLDKRRVTVAALVHLGIFYSALHLWADMSGTSGPT